jgi:glycosyltransferase involved in cell wall biosynthesis
MFLKALESVDLCNWTVYFIGPILAEFDSKINEFFIRNPNYKDRVIFTGNIGHKKTLWEYYNKSKVFVLTSNKEGFPIVFSEAKRFRNFLLSTEVSSSKDVIDDNKYGRTMPINDVVTLSAFLNQIINMKLDIDVYNEFDPLSISWDQCVNEIIL